jgi:hypothetical protein
MLITKNVSLPHVNRLAASHPPVWRYGSRVFLVADIGKTYKIYILHRQLDNADQQWIAKSNLRHILEKHLSFIFTVLTEFVFKVRKKR